MKLVDDIGKAWRWHSAQILAALTVAPMVWEQLPADLKDRVPDDWMPYVVACVAFAGLVGRLRAQP